MVWLNQRPAGQGGRESRRSLIISAVPEWGPSWQTSSVRSTEYLIARYAGKHNKYDVFILDIVILIDHCHLLQRQHLLAEVCVNATNHIPFSFRIPLVKVVIAQLLASATFPVVPLLVVL